MSNKKKNKQAVEIESIKQVDSISQPDLVEQTESVKKPVHKFNEVPYAKTGTKSAPVTMSVAEYNKKFIGI